MTHAHLPALEADGAVDILGVADPVRSAAEGLMDCWGDELPYYPDWRLDPPDRCLRSDVR